MISPSRIFNLTQRLQCKNSYSTGLQNNSASATFFNRNPRNLERMRIGYKPDGYHLDNPGKCFWHKIDLQISHRYVTARIIHFEKGEVLKASTGEWAIKKHLYRTVDTSSFINVGRVLAQRCLQCGIHEISNFITPSTSDGKVGLLLKALEDGGVCLKEPVQFKRSLPWDLGRPEKPWEVTE